MREEAVVVAARTRCADGDGANTGGARMVGNERAQVDRRGPVDRATGELRVDVGTHLVASTADRRTEMHLELGDRATMLHERVDAAVAELEMHLGPAIC